MQAYRFAKKSAHRMTQIKVSEGSLPADGLYKALFKRHCVTCLWLLNINHYRTLEQSVYE